MTAQDKQPIDADLGTLVRRQLLLLDFQIEEKGTTTRTWPRLPGLSAKESYHVFAAMERWGWVAGSRVDATEIRCIITSEGSNALNLLKMGRPLGEVAEQGFSVEDRCVLSSAVERSKKFPIKPMPLERVWTGTQRCWSTFNNSKPGPASVLCFGLAAAVAGIPYASPGSSLMTWGLLLIVLGVAIVAGRLAVAIRSSESARTAFRWLPLGVCGVVIVPLWLFVPETQGFSLSTYYWIVLFVLAVLSFIFRP